MTDIVPGNCAVNYIENVCQKCYTAYLNEDKRKFYFTERFKVYVAGKVYYWYIGFRLIG